MTSPHILDVHPQDIQTLIDNASRTRNVKASNDSQLGSGQMPLDYKFPEPQEEVLSVRALAVQRAIISKLNGVDVKSSRNPVVLAGGLFIHSLRFTEKARKIQLRSENDRIPDLQKLNATDDPEDFSELGFVVARRLKSKDIEDDIVYRDIDPTSFDDIEPQFTDDLIDVLKNIQYGVEGGRNKNIKYSKRLSRYLASSNSKPMVFPVVPPPKPPPGFDPRAYDQRRRDLIVSYLNSDVEVFPFDSTIGEYFTSSFGVEIDSEAVDFIDIKYITPDNIVAEIQNGLFDRDYVYLKESL